MHLQPLMTLNNAFDSFIVMFKTILSLWSDSFGFDSSGPKREPLLEFNGDDPWVALLKNDNEDDVLLWECVEKDMNNPTKKRWTSYDYRNTLRELHGSSSFAQVKWSVQNI